MLKAAASDSKIKAAKEKAEAEAKEGIIASVVGNLFNEVNFILTTGNKLFAFGSNYSGQLGVGDKIDKTAPTEVTSLRGKVAKVFVTMNSSFILTTDNNLFSFGNNLYGQLGLGDTNERYTPTEITSLRSKIDKVFFGTSALHAFVRTIDGKLLAFGFNDSGQLGVGDKIDKTAPTEVISMRGKVEEVFVSREHTFILTTGKKLFSFGKNSNGFLGLGDTTGRSVPTEITSLSGKVKQVFNGDYHSFVLTTDGELFAFGKNDTGSAWCRR